MGEIYIFKCESFVLVTGPVTKAGSLLGIKGGTKFEEVDHAYFRSDEDFVPPDRLSTPWGIALSPRAMEVVRELQLGQEIGFLETTLLDKRGKEVGVYTLLYSNRDHEVLDRSRSIFTRIPGTDLARDIHKWCIDESCVPNVDLFRERLSSEWLCSRVFAETFHAKRLSNCQFDPIWPSLQGPKFVVPSPILPRPSRSKPLKIAQPESQVPLVNHMRWRTILRRSWMALSPLVDSDSLFGISAPSEQGAIEKIEVEIGRSLPPLLSDFFGRGSSLVEVSWKAKESVSRELPAELVDGAWGELRLALEEVPALIDEWQEWQDFFEDASFFPGGSQPTFVFEDMFPLRFLTNGDALVMVAKGAQAGELYYLDHEGGELNWAKLGNSIPNFLETWAGLGFIGPSEYLSYFYDFSQHRFVDHGEVAKSWLARLKTNPTGLD